MTAVRIDSSDWPATITVGPGYYGLRIESEHGSVVRYVDATALIPGSSVTAEQRASPSGRNPQVAGSRPALGTVTCMEGP